MKVRIKFTKKGAMKFVGHLDIMRYFQKAIRRAGIDIVFTEGFSPHMVMSFAAPLGVGLTSEGEYLDIEIKTPVSSAEAVTRLNACMAEGVEIKSFRKIPEEKTSKAMSLVAAADYLVNFRAGYEPQNDWKEKITSFIAQETIPVLKKTKKSENEVDIRPMIYKLALEENMIFMKLATGSVNNLKPELVMDAFASYLGIELAPFALEVCRLEVYAEQGTPGNLQLISLEDLGEETN